jgi:hypothetical protein
VSSFITLQAEKLWMRVFVPQFFQQRELLTSIQELTHNLPPAIDAPAVSSDPERVG